MSERSGIGRGFGRSGARLSRWTVIVGRPARWLIAGWSISFARGVRRRISRPWQFRAQDSVVRCRWQGFGHWMRSIRAGVAGRRCGSPCERPERPHQRPQRRDYLRLPHRSFQNHVRRHRSAPMNLRRSVRCGKQLSLSGRCAINSVGEKGHSGSWPVMWCKGLSAGADSGAIQSSSGPRPPARSR